MEEKVKKSYQNLFHEHGYSPKTLGWDKGKQYLRFRELTNLWNLENKSILDVGCGFGDFINYLEFEGIKSFKYEGIDIVDEFIEIGKKNHQHENIKFRVGNLLSMEFHEIFDFGIASGTFNSKIDGINGYDYIESNLRKMFKNCKIGIAANFLTDRVDYKYDHNFNSSAEKILSIAYGLSRRIILRNEYFPYEFSIIIYKKQAFCKELSLFDDLKEKNYTN